MLKCVLFSLFVTAGVIVVAPGISGFMYLVAAASVLPGYASHLPADAMTRAGLPG